METILKRYENIALSNEDILNLLDGKTNIIMYPDLYKYSNIDEILYPYDSCVLLFAAKKNYGHWTAIIKRDNELEFFNSYGGWPDDSLKHIPYHYAIVSNQNIPYLSFLMYCSKYDLFYNEFQFQKKNKDIKTCGRHCVVRVFNKDMDIYQYKNYLDKLCLNMKTDYDGVVTYLTT